MATIRGLGFCWGVGVTTSTAFGTCKVQSYDVEQKGEESTIKDNTGTTVAWYGFDAMREATFEYVPTSASQTSSGSVTTPAFGDLITVTTTGGGDSVPSGSNWIVKSVSNKAGNTDFVKVSVKTTAYPSITT